MQHTFGTPHCRLVLGSVLAIMLGSGCDQAPIENDSGAAPEDASVALDGARVMVDSGLTPDASAGLDASVSVDAGVDAGPPPPGEMRTSLSQYGITWTFDRAYETGQFVTGDYWVVGPVQIVSVSPGPTGGRNGSMVDPVGAQAYDARAGRHDGTRGAVFPLAMDGGHSLVSSISHSETPSCTQGGVPGWETYTGYCQRGPIDTQAVLTVLSATPPADAFRPSYASHGSELYRSSDICWRGLPTLASPATVPDAAAILRHVERPWIDHLDSWEMQHGCATSNMFCYGREIGNVVSEVSAYALLDTPDRNQVVERLIQVGIDNYGVLRAGGGWGGDGGHFNGRKWPIVFAGALLGDAAMASPGTDIGNEDRQTYHGGSGTALWGRACGASACYFSNSCSYGSSCPNGPRDCRDPAQSVDGCVRYRNCCTSIVWVGEALAARLMGLRDSWNHDAFFDYVDRWMSGDVSGGGSSNNAFVDAMWEMYRDASEATSCL